jgi:hypothetical protein
MHSSNGNGSQFVHRQSSCRSTSLNEDSANNLFSPKSPHGKAFILGRQT